MTFDRTIYCCEYRENVGEFKGECISSTKMNILPISERIFSGSKKREFQVLRVYFIINLRVAVLSFSMTLST